MISVTFDSNVWEQIADEGKRQDSESCQKLYDAIQNKTIEPYISKCIFMYESFPRDKRLAFFANYGLKISIKEELQDNAIRLSINSEPENSYNKDDLPKKLKNITEQAIELGFRILRTPRIGAPLFKFDESWFAQDKKYTSHERNERYGQCGRYIEDLGAGKGFLQSVTNKEDKSFIEALRECNKDVAIKKFAKIIAEWADGDTIAAHYAYGIDYFCTNDKARNAGKNSVFPKNNRQILDKKFGIKIKTPENICALIQDC